MFGRDDITITVNLNGGSTGQQFKTTYETGEIVTLENPTKTDWLYIY